MTNMERILAKYPNLTERTIHGAVNLMRGLRPPTVAEKPITDEEWALLDPEMFG